jgi:hypothetical protein
MNLAHDALSRNSLDAKKRKMRKNYHMKFIKSVVFVFLLRMAGAHTTDNYK